MPKVTAPVILDSTGQRIAAALEGMAGKAQNRVLSLDNTRLASGIIEVVGIPEYVEDVEPYSAYGLSDTGWYVFARISAPDGVTVSALTTVTGAAGAIVTTGAETSLSVSRSPPRLRSSPSSGTARTATRLFSKPPTWPSGTWTTARRSTSTIFRATPPGIINSPRTRPLWPGRGISPSPETSTPSRRSRPSAIS